MKKILSFLLLAAMVVGCIVPAVITSAAAGTIAIESVEKMEGTGNTFTAAISISENPGIADLAVVVYFKTAELALDEDNDDAFANSIFPCEDNGISKVKANKVAGYLPEGANAAEYSAYIVEAFGEYGEEVDYNAVTENGVVVNFPFAFAGTPAINDVYTYGVTLDHACNENGEDVEVTAETTGSVTYVKDPLIGKYDSFTLFMDPADADVVPGTASIEVDIRIDANPGIWSTRFVVVYPNELTLQGVDENAGVNGTVFQNKDYNVGKINLPLNSEDHLAKYKELYATLGLDRDSYQGATFVWLPEDPNAVITNNGILNTLTFDLPADANVGDTYEISVVTIAGDTFWAGTDEVGQPVFVDKDFANIYGCTVTIACEHASTTTDHLDATCGTAGYDRVICATCGAVLEETVIEATGVHTPGDPVIVNSTCVVAGTSTVYCTVCNEVLSSTELGLAEHTPGAEATCTTAQTCTVCDAVIVEALGHNAGDAVVINPTCTEDGSSVVSCTRCGEVISTTVLEATGHNYLNSADTVIVPPTCTTEGYTVKTCNTCGDKWTTDIVDPWGHEAGDPVVVDATYYADGSSTVYCDTCGEVLSAEVLPRLTIALTVKLVDVNGNELYTKTGDTYIDEAVLDLSILADVVPGYTVVIDEAWDVVDETLTLNLAEEPTAEFVMEFTPNTDIVYTVVYVDAEGNKLADDKVVEGQTMATEVTEAAIAIDGYTADVAEQKLVLEATDNVITFTYTKDAVEEDKEDDKDQDNESSQTGDNVMYIVIALAVVIVASVAVIIIRRKRSAN